PSSIAQGEAQDSTQLSATSLEVSFQTELTNYAATHTREELLAYAQIRLNQLTAEALADHSLPTTTQSGASYAYPEPFYEGDPDLNGPTDYQFCINTRSEECRRQYNAELLASAATSSAIFAGCVGLTSGTALIACAAAAMAVHALNIAAAKERFQACLTRAYSDCALAYGRKR
ncbi:MAG TPA: hypothetical protein VHH35_19410, partial [Pyrinomonadaceae bacterium]|nr:hypothetical protein [Pyrinomonadaceae bacterium]